MFSCLFFPCEICNKHSQYKGRNRRELFSLWLFISVFSTFQPLHFSVFYSATVSHNFSLPLSLCLHLSLFYSLPPLHLITVFHFSFSLSLTLQLLALVYSLSVSLSLSIWQTEGWWVCCRSNSFIQPLSVGTSSITQWRHTNTTVFPRQIDLVVSVRKQNETRQHEHPSLTLSIPPSFPHPSICPLYSLTCWLHTAQAKTTEE